MSTRGEYCYCIGRQVIELNGITDFQERPSRSDFSSSLTPHSLLRRTLGHQNRQSISYIGLTSEHDPQLLTHYTFASNGEHKGHNVTYRHVGYHLASNASNFLIKDDLPIEVEEEIRDLDAIEAVVAPHGPALVELYFRIVHPSFPILHKKVFLEKHGRTYRELTPTGLGAVYIIALDWWAYSPETCNLAKPDSKELDSLVRKSMMECLHRPKISDLQGSLILLQRTEFNSWPLTGQLVAVAQELGLHDDCSAWNLPEWEPGVRKRVAWALFAQDKWGALTHGRPSHLSASNWGVPPLQTTDFPETSMDDDDAEGSVEVEKGRLIFVHFITLTEILADVLDAFFTLKKAKSLVENSTAELLLLARPMQDRLRQWLSDLPAQLSMEDNKSRKLSSTGAYGLDALPAVQFLHLRSCTLPSQAELHRLSPSSLLRCTDDTQQSHTWCVRSRHSRYLSPTQHSFSCHCLPISNNRSR